MTSRDPVRACHYPNRADAGALATGLLDDASRVAAVQQHIEQCNHCAARYMEACAINAVALDEARRQRFQARCKFAVAAAAAIIVAIVIGPKVGTRPRVYSVEVATAVPVALAVDGDSEAPATTRVLRLAGGDHAISADDADFEAATSSIRVTSDGRMVVPLRAKHPMSRQAIARVLRRVDHDYPTMKFDMQRSTSPVIGVAAEQPRRRLTAAPQVITLWSSSAFPAVPLRIASADDRHDVIATARLDMLPGRNTWRLTAEERGRLRPDVEYRIETTSTEPAFTPSEFTIDSPERVRATLATLDGLASQFAPSDPTIDAAKAFELLHSGYPADALRLASELEAAELVAGRDRPIALAELAVLAVEAMDMKGTPLWTERVNILDELRR